MLIARQQNLLQRRLDNQNRHQTLREGTPSIDEILKEEAKREETKRDEQISQIKQKEQIFKNALKDLNDLEMEEEKKEEAKATLEENENDDVIKPRS